MNKGELYPDHLLFSSFLYSLGRNKIGAKGVAAIADAMQSMTLCNLQELRLVIEAVLSSIKD